MSPLPIVLAEVGPSDHPYLVYVVIGGVIALASVWHHVTSAVLNMRRLKSEDAKEGKDFATREQLREVHGRVDAVFLDQGKMRGEMITAIHAVGDKFTDGLRDVRDQMSGVQRSLGRVETLELILKEHGADIDQLQGRSKRGA
jgi:hypothetical protein